MPMHNLVVYANNYSKASGSLWKYYRDEPALTNAVAIANFHAVDNSASLKINKKITGKSADSGTKDIEIMVPLKYLSNFWRILEMPLTNCDINNILSWSGKWMLSNDTKATIFAITDTKLNVSVVTVSTQDNVNLFQHLESGFKRTIEQNKYQPKVSLEAPNPNLGFLIDPSFQGVNRLFDLSFENKDDRTVRTKYYFPTVDIKDYNVMIDRKNFFHQPVKNNSRTYDKIRKIAIGQKR